MGNTLRNTAIGIAALTALGTSFVIGTTVTRSPQPSAGPGVLEAAGAKPTIGRVTSAPVTGALNSARSCDELLDWYIAQGVKRVGPYGWDSPFAITDGFAVAEDSAVAPAPAAKATDGLRSATSSATGTNVQEAGVDEPDLVKTNDSTLVRIQEDTLTTYDVTGAHPDRLSTLRLAAIVDAEILLTDDQVVVLGIDEKSASDVGGTRMTHVDISDPAAPRVIDTKVFSSTMVSASQHDTTIRLVLSQAPPDLDFTHPRRWPLGWPGEEAALKRNQEKVRASTLADWLPTVAGDSGDREPLVQCTDVVIPEDDAGLGTLSVVGFEADGSENESEIWSVTAVATESRTVYTSIDRIYLASQTTGSQNGWEDIWRNSECCLDGWRRPGPIDDGRTHLHAFELTGIGARYLASGEVEGQVADRWSMDEAGGVLRVAVGQTNATGSFNSIVTLSVDGNDLIEVGRLDDLGANEDIQSMRWFDSMAVMVTFRQIDPLYAIDLSDAETPRLLGQLKIPGFSDYLHPLGPRRIIGMGVAGNKEGLTGGAQAGLFDLSDVTRPRRESTVGYGPRTTALAGQDPRQFTWLPDRRIALTVVSRGDGSSTGFVSVLALTDGKLRNRMVEVEYGDEVSQVRLVPLASGPSAGKVVLVTGDDISFFTP
jgi:Beta propeller domain